MKHCSLHVKMMSSIFALLAFPLMASGQDTPSFVDYDNLFIYSTSYGPGELYEQGPVGKVFLSVVSDEIFIKKKTDVTQEAIDDVVLDRIPAARISWINDDVCTVIADEQSIESVMDDLRAEEAIISVRPAYIRKVYKDLMGIYPVKQVAIYGFTDEISAGINWNMTDEAHTLIASLGLQTERVFEADERQLRIYAAKGTDIIAIANSLYESGYFYISNPLVNIAVRTLDAERLDVSSLDFLYNSKGKKYYLYKSPGRFMVTKERDTDKTSVESAIFRHLSGASLDWKTDNRCQVETEESLVDDAIMGIRSEASVASANRSYMTLSNYESALKDGTNYPKDMNIDQKIILKFKDGVTKTVSDSLLNAFNLTAMKEPDYYYTWVAPKSADIFKICDAIYESGYVDWIDPNWITGFQVIWASSGSGTTDIKDPSASMISERYFDMLGRIVDSPSGLTIVVTRYSDGSTRTEKKLFK